MMTTADLSLKFDPAYEKSRAFRQPAEFADAYRPRLVQADPPRHGAEGALSRAGCRPKT